MRFNSKAALVLLLLLFHFYTRHAAAVAIPLSPGEGLYPFVYRVSLNLMEGRGFYQVLFPETAEAAPLRDFTMFGRTSLTGAEMDAYFRQPYSAPVHYDSQLHQADVPLPANDAPFIDDHYKTRVLDLRVAALLWKWFGIRWSVYFFFYTLVSTLAALCIFLLGREAGGFWAGIVALIVYTACPLENEYLIRSIRDISPLWFASFGFAFTACVAGKSRSRPVRLISYAGAGLVAALGYGWRPDILILPPFLLGFLALRLVFDRYRLTEVAAAAGLFVAGTVLCLGGIRALSPGGGLSPQFGFHMAYYGHAARANLLGIEDSHNVFRCDINTHLAAGYYAVANGLEGGGEPYLSPAYGAACRSIFLAEMGYDSWHIVSQFPVFLFRAMRGSGLHDLPVNTDYYPSLPRWPAALAWARSLILDPIYQLAPYLAIIGFVGTLLWVRPVPVAAAVAAFLLYYGAILLSVLPEYKHTGLLVLPLCVLSGLAVTSILNQSWRQLNGRPGVIAALAVLAIWLAACGIAYAYSLHSRAALIEQIREASAGAPETGGLLGPRLFVVRRSEHEQPDRVGYLFEIDAGAHPGWLRSRGLRETEVARFYETNHQLFPNRKQWFFLTSFPGNFGTVEFNNTVMLDGDARIISVRKVDLTHWKDLEVSTVFYDGQRSAGSPSLVSDAVSNRTIYGLPSLDRDLLSAGERFALEGANPHQVVLSGPPAQAMAIRLADSPTAMSIAPDLLTIAAGAVKELEANSIRLTTPSAGGQAWLQSPNFTADHESTIYLRVRYRLRKGNVAIALFPADGGAASVCQQTQAERVGGLWTETVSLHRRAGQAMFFVLANGYAPLDQPTQAEISEVRLYAE